MNRDRPGGSAFDESYYRDTFVDDLPRFSVAWWSVRFYVRLCRRLLRGRGQPRVLEAGCAHGQILRRLAPRAQTWGVDISEYAIDRAREITPRSRLFVADLGEDLPAEVSQESFHLILARYVFEHLASPAEAINTLSERLVPGGALLFAVPDPSSPGRRLKGENWFAYQDETHVSLLASHEWLAMTREAGLAIESTFSDGLWDVPYLRGIPALMQYPLFSLPTIVSVALAWPFIPAGWGENLIVVARRGR